MQKFKLRFKGYIVNKMEGGEAPANSFEDIGKSRLMQLSTIKSICVTLLVIRKKIKDNLLYFKTLVDEQQYMTRR